MASKKKETKQAEVDESEDAAMETELFLAVLKSRLGRYGYFACMASDWNEHNVVQLSVNTISRLTIHL